MASKEQHTKALDMFKDWSNYLLVTTVAALGWVVSKDAAIHAPVAVFCFAASAVFGILTLALIPLVAEQLTDLAPVPTPPPTPPKEPPPPSFHDVPGYFRLGWMCGPQFAVRLKWVCWPQHVLFIVGIATFSAAYFFQSPVESSLPSAPYWGRH